MRGPLKLVKETWLSENPPNLHLLDYVERFRGRLKQVCELAQANVKDSQDKMKRLYDLKVQKHSFKPGDKVLVLLPVPGNVLKARHQGPYEVERKVSELDYVIKTPGCRKSTQFCYLNMLKPYFDRSRSDQVLVVNHNTARSSQNFGELSDFKMEPLDDNEYKPKPNNSDILLNLDRKLEHCLSNKAELSEMILKYTGLFPDVPSKTNLVQHDVDVGDARPVKQHPYRVNPLKLKQVRKEIEYMLENNIAKHSQSSWASHLYWYPNQMVLKDTVQIFAK